MAVAEQSISMKTRRKTEVRIILAWHAFKHLKQPSESLVVYKESF